MCGIAGWIDYKRDLRSEADVLSDMSEVLSPRGPDEKGEWYSPECCLVHRRLVVIDRINGKQPMSRGSYIICYNGELYNTDELRNCLKGLGYRFHGHSDTEVLLCAYIEWGSGCLERLNGIFAFAVWNEIEKTLFLARDRAGVKPLFYYTYENGIVFSSEIKALLRNPLIKPVIDREGIASIMLLGPARKPSDAVFKGVFALEPGCCAYFDRSGLHKRKYFRIKAKKHEEDLDETAQHLYSLITDSVERQLISDVPLCTFLSGGLDSSIISSVASDKFRREGRTLNTFSVDYTDNRKNFRSSMFQPDEDAPWILKMSEFIKSRHTNVEIDTPELAAALDESVYARDLPGMADVDSSLYLFCAQVKKSFPVALSGECADELLGGYPWYRNEEMLNSKGFPWAQSTDERFGLIREGIFTSDFSPTEYVNALADKTAQEADLLGSDTPFDVKTRQMFMLNVYWFMQTLLDRKDRCSMAHGLEVRVPFCDHRIIEYAYNIPSEMKFFMGREKGLVRRAFEKILPYDVCWRKKSPYPKTHNPTYLTAVTERLRELTAQENCRLYELIERKSVRRLIETGGTAFSKNWYGQLMTAPQLLAYLIQLELWLRRYNVIIRP